MELYKPFDDDMELLELMFSSLGSDLALAQCFCTMYPFYPVGMVMYSLCYYMLEVCNFLFYFTGGYN